jgi:hypothetical protein
MILFPNQTVARPTDVRDGDLEEFRKREGGVAPRDIVEEASLDSFPASDAPPWTLAAIGPPARPARSEAGVPESGAP